MTSKKRRQRGSRTHGGGTHKNRRGAGNRGGRGNAGSRKHEIHHHGPWRKHGFKRPEKAVDSVAEVRVQTIDEDAALLAAEGVAEADGDGYRVDARDVAEDGHEVDVVKVLGGGQVRQELHVTADAFTDGAVDLIEAAGGSVERTERAEAADGADSEPTDETVEEGEA
jgi:large subunit ribosomal protein L15